MAYRAAHPGAWAGQVVGSGQCVAYVQRACGAPHTSRWRRGQQVRGNPVEPGTAIATFEPDGTYGNHTDGRSHGAVLVGEVPGGLRVWDQWRNHPVRQRTIRFRGGHGHPVNDGDAFHVIEEPEL